MIRFAGHKNGQDESLDFQDRLGYFDLNSQNVFALISKQDCHTVLAIGDSTFPILDYSRQADSSICKIHAAVNVSSIG